MMSRHARESIASSITDASIGAAQALGHTLKAKAEKITRMRNELAQAEHDYECGKVLAEAIALRQVTEIEKLSPKNHTPRVSINLTDVRERLNSAVRNGGDDDVLEMALLLSQAMIRAERERRKHEKKLAPEREKCRVAREARESGHGR